MSRLKAHWLPAAYLQFFSASGRPEGRRTVVCAANASGARFTSVESVCSTKDLYSRSDPHAAEQALQHAERLYADVVRSLLVSTSLEGQRQIDALLCLFHLYLRNPVLENRTSIETAELLNPMHYAFLWNEVAATGSPTDPTSADALRSAIEASWEIQALRAHENPLVTSDNPVKLFGLRSELLFALLPATPELLLAAVRRGHAVITTSALSSSDVEALNSLQVRTCIREVYADHDLTPDSPQIRAMIGSPGARTGWIDSDRASVRYHQYTADELTFLSVDRSSLGAG